MASRLPLCEHCKVPEMPCVLPCNHVFCFGYLEANEVKYRVGSDRMRCPSISCIKPCTCRIPTFSDIPSDHTNPTCRYLSSSFKLSTELLVCYACLIQALYVNQQEFPLPHPNGHSGPPFGIAINKAARYCLDCTLGYCNDHDVQYHRNWQNLEHARRPTQGLDRKLLKPMSNTSGMMNKVAKFEINATIINGKMPIGKTPPDNPIDLSSHRDRCKPDGSTRRSNESHLRPEPVGTNQPGPEVCSGSQQTPSVSPRSSGYSRVSHISEQPLLVPANSLVSLFDGQDGLNESHEN